MTAATCFPASPTPVPGSAFARSPRTTFAPRPVALVVSPAPAVAPRQPVSPGVAGAERPLATVHRLPAGSAVYRRRRLAVVAVVVGLALGLVLFVRHADATPTPEGRLAESTTIVVQPGDSLWSLAATLAPDGDLRALVSELETIAGGSVLQPGQRLVIPGHLLD